MVTIKSRVAKGLEWGAVTNSCCYLLIEVADLIQRMWEENQISVLQLREIGWVALFCCLEDLRLEEANNASLVFILTAEQGSEITPINHTFLGNSNQRGKHIVNGFPLTKRKKTFLSKLF